MLNTFFSYDIINFYYNKIDDIYVYAIGCELSTYDANKIAELFNKQKTHCIIVSTCAVTENSFLISKNLIKILKILHPTYEVIITGCAVNYDQTPFEEYGKCFINEHKMIPSNYGLIDCYNSKFNHMAENNTEGYVKIQDGCSGSCNYCIVPKLRCKPFSISYDKIKEDIENLISQKCYHIKLVATEVCNYNYNNTNLIQLVEQIIHDFPKIQQLSFNAIDPTNVKIVKELLVLSKQYRQLKNELMLAIQSGSDTVLKLMNRHNTTQNTRDIMEYANQLDIPVSWHLIIGYPGETEQLFDETYKLIEELKPMSVQFHPFSIRKNTAAEHLQNIIDNDCIYDRIQKCKKLIQTYKPDFYQNDVQFNDIRISTNFDTNLQNTTFTNIYDINQLRTALHTQTNSINYIFDPKSDNKFLELITKIVASADKKYNLNMICNIDNAFIEYCKSNNFQNINEISYRYLSNIILNFNSKIFELKLENWKFLIAFLKNKKIDNLYDNLANILVNDAINCKDIREILLLLKNE